MITNASNIITDEEELVKVLNNHCINIVENSCGRKPFHTARDNNIDNIT